MKVSSWEGKTLNMKMSLLPEVRETAMTVVCYLSGKNGDAPKGAVGAPGRGSKKGSLAVQPVVRFYCHQFGHYRHAAPAQDDVLEVFLTGFQDLQGFILKTNGLHPVNPVILSKKYTSSSRRTTCRVKTKKPNRQAVAPARSERDQHVCVRRANRTGG